MEGACKKLTETLQVDINFDTISVGSIASASGVFNGTNSQFGWSTHSKTNSGFGTVSGNKCLIYRNFSMVYDPDIIDTPIDDRDLMSGGMTTT